MDKILESQLNKATELIVSKFSPTVIYLIGSASRDELREDSDIDLAFLSQMKISSLECFDLAQELYDFFKRDVDLIDLKKASTVFKAHVIHYGKVIYCNNIDYRMTFEMRSYKEYALLNEERHEILSRVRESGKVYE